MTVCSSEPLSALTWHGGITNVVQDGLELSTAVTKVVFTVIYRLKHIFSKLRWWVCKDIFDLYLYLVPSLIKNTIPPPLYIKKLQLWSHLFTDHHDTSAAFIIPPLAVSLISSGVATLEPLAFVMDTKTSFALTNEMPLTLRPRTISTTVGWNYTVMTICSIKQWITAVWLTMCDSNELRGTGINPKQHQNVTFKSLDRLLVLTGSDKPASMLTKGGFGRMRGLCCDRRDRCCYGLGSVYIHTVGLFVTHLRIQVNYDAERWG